MPNGKGYALEFHKSHYRATDIPFMCATGYGFLCITFHTQKDEEQSLVSNANPDDPDQSFTEIAVSSNALFIRGIKDKQRVDIPIQHNCRQWTTLFVDWMVTETNITGNYIINNDKKLMGKFSLPIGLLCGNYIDIGCRGHILSHPFYGAISTLEIHTSHKGKVISPALRDLVINDQLIHGDKDMPPAKKKKCI